MLEVTGLTQRAILEGVMNWKVWVSALTVMVALGCGGSGGELTSAEIADIYDVCATKPVKYISSIGGSPRGDCLDAAGTLVRAYNQGGSCDFQKIVSGLHTGRGLDPRKNASVIAYCPIPDPRPWYQQVQEWGGWWVLILVVFMVLGVGFSYVVWREHYFPKFD